MSEPINDGGPAFPCEVERMFASQLQHEPIMTLAKLPGMSMRDWFAGQALAGWFACQTTSSRNDFKDTAALCYEAADAMLAERQKGTK